MEIKRKRWTTIRVPEEVANLIRRIRDKEGKVNWEVIHDAISFYEWITRTPTRKAKLSDVEKVSWYITKLAVGYGFFVSNPNEETYGKLKERVEELNNRLGVDAGILLRLADYYMRAKDDELRKKIRIDFNLALKMVIKEILVTRLFELELKEVTPKI